jgi:hypothetical protein
LIKRFALIFAIFGFCFTAHAQFYTTTFPAVENPIAQGSPPIWLNGALNCTHMTNVQTVLGNGGVQMATGTTVNNTTTFNDGTAILTGTWGTTQSATAVVHTINQPINAEQEEVEIRLRSSCFGNTDNGYELDASVQGASGSLYFVIVRHNGPAGNFCFLNLSGGCDAVYNPSQHAITNVHIADGETISGTATGTNPTTLKFFHQGTLVMTRTDNGSGGVSCTGACITGPYTGGAPGMGFWNLNGVASDFLNYGFSTFTAQGGVLAATCNQSDVFTAIGSVNDGDTVLIPDGTCDWTNGLTGQFAINTSKQIQILAQHINTTAPLVYGSPPARSVTIINDTSTINASTNQWQGNWSNTTAYVVGDRVLNNFTGCAAPFHCDGNYYLAISPNTGQQPPNATFWKPVAALIGLTSGNNFHQRIAGIYFKETSQPILNAIATSGTGTKEPFLDNDTIEIAQRFGNEPQISVLAITGIGALSWNTYIVGVTTAGVPAGECCPGGASVHIESPYPWYNADTLGMADVDALGNHGNINVYFEDGVWDNFGQGWDCDNNCRFVARHMVLNGIAAQTHGLSSTTGGRQVEDYNNQIGNPKNGRNLSRRYNWDREGIWYIHDNMVAYQDEGFGAATLLDSIVECGPGATCANDGSVAYPHFKVPGGEQTSWSCSTCTGNQSTSTPANHPSYIWNNCISGHALPCTGDSHIAANGGASPFFFQLGRDYFVDSGAPAGYTPFTYPHPDRALTFGGGTTSAPASPVTSDSPNPMAFGNVTIGSPSTQTLTITNVGMATLVVTANGLGDTTVWSKNTSTCVPTPNVAPGGTCTIGVTFSPTATGLKTTTLSITSNAPSSPDIINLSGTGVSGAQPGINIAPASPFNYGSVVVGANSSQSFTITSTTTAALVMGSPPATISGTNAADFVLTSGCTAGQSLAQSQTCLETVKFTPSATGSRTAQLNISDNAAGSPQIIQLSGTGTTPIASVSPAAAVFNNVVVNQTPAIPIILQNIGSAPLSVSSIVMSGATFSQTNNCPALLGAGASCTIQVTFAPTVTGTASGTLTITDNSSTGSTQTVPASGSGILVPSTMSGVQLQGVQVQ